MSGPISQFPEFEHNSPNSEIDKVYFDLRAEDHDFHGADMVTTFSREWHEPNSLAKRHGHRDLSVSL